MPYYEWRISIRGMQIRSDWPRAERIGSMAARGYGVASERSSLSTPVGLGLCTRNSKGENPMRRAFETACKCPRYATLRWRTTGRGLVYGDQPYSRGDEHVETCLKGVRDVKNSLFGRLQSARAGREVKDGSPQTLSRCSSIAIRRLAKCVLPNLF